MTTSSERGERLGNRNAIPHLTLDAFQTLACTADRQPDASLAFMLLGLFGEAGSLLSVVKKKHRDSISFVGYAPAVIEELGDVL